MTDQWTPSGPLTPINDWGSTCGCAPVVGPASADNVVITGSPGAITSAPNQKPLWSLVLNDGTPAADFRLDRYSDLGALAGSPIGISRATGVVSFDDPVMLAADPVDPLEAVTKHYVDVNALTDAPNDGQLYGRASGAWATAYSTTNPANYQTAAQVTASLAGYLPLTGGTVSGGTAFTAGIILAGPANLSLGGGTAGQVLTKGAGTGQVAWAAPGLSDAPSDGQFYTRQNAAWAVSPGGMTDAPNDGTAYARKSAAWAHLTHTDITDWTATLAPYALATSVPIASSTLPLPSGTAAIGTSTTYARADHVHPGSAALGENRIINGDMRIDQRNNGAVGSAIGYTVDRWTYLATQTGKFLWQRAGPSTAASLTQAGFPYVLAFNSSSAYAALAADYFVITQLLEADTVGDFAWGTASAQPVTLSFAVFASLTGTFGGSIRNAGGTRSYPFSYSIPTANTWTKIVITVPGDTIGTWLSGGNAAFGTVNFSLGAGATFSGPANAWAAGNFITPTGAVSVVATNGANFAVTGVKLEIGSVATPFNRQSLAKSLADCQRYYQLVQACARFQASAASQTGTVSLNWQTMRVAPTATVATAGTSSNQAATFPQAFAITPQGSRFVVQSAAAGDCFALDYTYAMNAEL